MRINSTSKTLRSVVIVIAICLVLPAWAQKAKLELKNLEKLSSKASDVNDITLDGAMLQLALTLLQQTDDPDAAKLRDAVKDLKGIYVKSFEFDSPGQYSQEDVDAIRAQLAAPGWQRIVESSSRKSREHNEIFVMKEGNVFTGLAILVAEPTELTVVNIVGLIDMAKLGELEGHFGIPGETGVHKQKLQKPATKPRPQEGQPQKNEATDDRDDEN
ncbi:MAG TPA: DUF4252 domain-containing protein [Candidatus Angelobacter sp.]|nr:DUF4252 domain-containing protein [Candidatus Angelobacter sp.]